MTTYSLRCRVASCRHRRVGTKHPDEYKQVYRCPSCKALAGWRIENRDYNKTPMCGCGQSPLYPHRKAKYKFCDFHPQGFYNQAKRQGVPDESIPLEYIGKKMKESDPCPF